MRDQLTAARGELSEQARLLQDLGISATSRMRGSAEELAGQMQIAEEKAQGIEKAGSIVTANLSTLLTALPQAQEQLAAVARDIGASGSTAIEQATLLQSEMEAIALLTERSKKETLDATQALSGQLLELQDATKTAAAEIEDMTRSEEQPSEAVLESAGEAANRAEGQTPELKS